MANHRLRKLLDLAHEVTECTNCDAWVAHGCEPAHENGISAGKGQSIKSQDHRHAAMCHACHAWYDSGSVGLDPSQRYQPTREDKQEMWTRAFKATLDLYWRNNWLKVA